MTKLWNLPKIENIFIFFFFVESKFVWEEFIFFLGFEHEMQGGVISFFQKIVLFYLIQTFVTFFKIFLVIFKLIINMGKTLNQADFVFYLLTFGCHWILVGTFEEKARNFLRLVKIIFSVEKFVTRIGKVRHSLLWYFW